MNPDFLLTATILFGGIGGAAANFLLMPPPGSEIRNCQTFLRLVIGGIFVAFTVPLFLSLAQSTLVQQILNPSEGHDRFPELLIFAGFCIVVSFSSRAFMTNLSSRILADLAKTKENSEKTKENSEQVKELAKQTRDKVERVEDAVGETLDLASGDATDRPIIQTSIIAQEEIPTVPLTPTEKKTLQATGRLTMRTATGIAKDAGIPRNQVGEILDVLIGKSLVEKSNSPNTGGLRHRLTPLGMAVLNKELRENNIG
jgi:DNA-binding MarR family transcriptional regulator